MSNEAMVYELSMKSLEFMKACIEIAKKYECDVVKTVQNTALTHLRMAHDEGAIKSLTLKL